LNQFAVDLAEFLKQLQKIDTSNGPIAGEHNFYRGGNLSTYDKETQKALKSLKLLLPINKLNNIWLAALESK
jgi:aminoglycoside phosphotransferase (APT) family kinase protein